MRMIFLWLSISNIPFIIRVLTYEVVLRHNESSIMLFSILSLLLDISNLAALLWRNALWMI